MPRLRRTTLILASAAAALAGLAPLPAAATLPHPAVVSADPDDTTPHVVDGSVRAIVEVGDTVVVGGTFTQVRNTGTTAAIAQPKLFALDKRTGKVLTAFRPALDGDVLTLAVAPDGASVFVGGAFSTVNGTTTRRLAKVRLSDGALVPGFKAPAVDGQVVDMKIASRALYLGGTWQRIGGLARPGLAAVDPTTGAVDPTLAVALSAPARGGTTQVTSLDLTPDGRRLAVLGNFTRADGLVRHQIAMVDTGAPGARATVVPDWATDRYAADCSPSFAMYVRELDISPDGSYLVVVTTGAYRKDLLCDTAARWEVGARGAALQPTWVAYTGGDTLHSVTTTGSAVYIGGHQRWLNNPYAADRAGPGAVARDGIAALDPRTGLPLSWNPGRTRGVGVFDILATRDGIWAGSDTESFGGEFHGRLARFPLAGGSAVPPAAARPLPGTVALFGADDTVSLRECTSELACTARAGATGGVPWGSTRGAFMLSGRLYYGLNDGTLRTRTYDGTVFGPEAVVDLRGLSSNLTSSTNFSTELRGATGMYAVGGRLYYVLAGQSKLYWRWFTAESGVVGAERYEAASADLPGVRWADVRSAFASGTSLYAATPAGLRRIALTPQGVPTGSWTAVSTPLPWIGRGAVVLSPAGYDPAPTAAPSVVQAAPRCTDLTCTFDGSPSSDPDGGEVALSWDLGDGTRATGTTASRTYAAAGTYRVVLTGYDDEGRAGTATTTVTVTAPRPNAAPAASFTADCTGLTCAFRDTSTDPDGDALDARAWSFAGQPSSEGASATSWTAPGAGTYPVALTVTDARGATSTRTGSVSLVEGAVAHRASAARALRSTQGLAVPVPAQVRAGDGLVLVTTTAWDVGTSAPAGVTGWTEVGTTLGSGGVRTRVWQKVAVQADAGRTVTVPLAGAAKGTVQVLAYSGTGAAPVASYAGRAEEAVTAQHASPGATVAEAGSVVVDVWSDVTAATTSWTVPEGSTARTLAVDAGAGAGGVSTVAADRGPLPAGTVPAAVATADAASARATALTLVLAPGRSTAAV